LATQKKFGKADADYREASTILEQLAPEYPKDPQVREELGAILNDWGFMLGKNGDVAGGEVLLRRAVDVYRNLADEFSSRPSHRQAAAYVLTNLGSLLKDNGRVPEAVVAFEQAIGLHEKLAAEFTQVSKFDEALLQTLRFLIQTRVALNEWPKARELLKKAVAQQQKLFALSPDDNRRPLADLQKELTEACLRVNDIPSAYNASCEAAKLVPDKWELWHRAACLGARCLSEAIRDVSLPRETRESIVTRYEEEVIELLRQAATKGFDRVAQFPADEGVPSLAVHPQFQTILTIRPPGAQTPEEQLRALERCPTKFAFTYKHPPDPGRRIWARKGITWTETQPSGVQNVYVIAGPTTVNEVEGSELRRSDGSSTTLFVPYRESKGTKKLLIKGSSGRWGYLGTMEEIE
jgi:tetratricopeptide (TPR) repeat protein